MPDYWIVALILVDIIALGCIIALLVDIEIKLESNYQSGWTRELPPPPSDFNRPNLSDFEPPTRRHLD